MPVDGGFFTTGDDAERLVARSKDVLDNATPSANGLAAVALVRLAALTGDDRYRAKAEGVIGLLASVAEEHPTAFAQRPHRRRPARRRTDRGRRGRRRVPSS